MCSSSKCTSSGSCTHAIAPAMPQASSNTGHGKEEPHYAHSPSARPAHPGPSRNWPALCMFPPNTPVSTPHKHTCAANMHLHAEKYIPDHHLHARPTITHTTLYPFCQNPHMVLAHCCPWNLVTSLSSLITSMRLPMVLVTVLMMPSMLMMSTVL